MTKGSYIGMMFLLGSMILNVTLAASVTRDGTVRKEILADGRVATAKTRFARKENHALEGVENADPVADTSLEPEDNEAVPDPNEPPEVEEHEEHVPDQFEIDDDDYDGTGGGKECPPNGYGGYCVNAYGFSRPDCKRRAAHYGDVMWICSQCAWAKDDMWMTEEGCTQKMDMALDMGDAKWHRVDVIPTPPPTDGPWIMSPVEGDAAQVASEATTGYSMQNSGTCAKPITTQAECDAAATALGRPDTSSQINANPSSTYDPPYCHEEEGELRFKDGEAGSLCSTAEPCLCMN
jgi:hypothetical protein